MRLEDIGFYTLKDSRARDASADSPLWRCELILTDRCNFNCPYCRTIQRGCRGDIPYTMARRVIDLWAGEGLVNVRLSGGEPTLWRPLEKLIRYIKGRGVERIALSTNGSAPARYYRKLVEAGANDFSVSLDACCSSTGARMAGVNNWQLVVDNIKVLSDLTYVTVGVVINGDNVEEATKTVELAHNLGVADIRVITAAQYNGELGVKTRLTERHPILKYRLTNPRGVRGLEDCDTNKCFLVQDDMVVAGGKHFPCIIYFREGGRPIGEVGPDMRQERIAWFGKHNTKQDDICCTNCLDVCAAYNNKAASYRDYRGHE